MAVPTFTMRQLLEAGVHFGHQTRRWNPKMEPYLFGVRNDIHIIDLQQTVPMLYRALEFVHGIVSGGGRVLFVGTKRQAAEPLAEAAKRCGQYYVNHRWLGGMLTNWRTISNSITRLKVLDTQLSEEQLGLTKKELLHLTRERTKLDRALGGIREMGGLPDVVFIIDTNKEEIAKHEATKLGIPLVAVIDSNSDPDGIGYPIPGNDDATRSIHFYCDMMARTVLEGLQAELSASGGDAGAKAEAPQQEMPETETPADAGAAAEPASEPALAEAPAAEKADEKPAAEAAASAPPAAEEPSSPPAEEPVAEKPVAVAPAAEPAAPEPPAEQPPAADAEKADTPNPD
jgi:small subunit ribosomal protein S2